MRRTADSVGAVEEREGARGRSDGEKRDLPPSAACGTAVRAPARARPRRPTTLRLAGAAGGERARAARGGGPAWPQRPSARKCALCAARIIVPPAWRSCSSARSRRSRRPPTRRWRDTARTPSCPTSCCAVRAAQTAQFACNPPPRLTRATSHRTNRHILTSFAYRNASRDCRHRGAGRQGQASNACKIHAAARTPAEQPAASHAALQSL